MKKLFSLFTAVILLVVCSNAFASVGIRLNGTMVGTATDLNIGCGSGTNSVVTSDGSIYNINCSPNLQNTGVANGGVTSLATIDTGVPLTFALVKKAISTTGTSADTLPNGTPGQMMTILITSAVSGTWTLTPTTASGIKSVAFNAAGQSASFLYLNDTNGWILLGTGSSGATNDPTVTLGN